jgi:hypothetical protein
MTFTINFAIQHQTSQKILAQANPNPKLKDISLQNFFRKARHVARRWG